MRRARLTQEEKAEIVRMRVEDRMSIPDIARAMGSNNSTIHELVQPFPLDPGELAHKKAANLAAARAARIGRNGFVGGQEWTEDDDRRLERLWPLKAKERLKAAFPDRSWAAIGRRAWQLGIRRSRSASNRGGKSNFIDPIFVQLREIREAREITREALADKIGIHYVLLARYELGENRPSWLNFRAWIDALQCEMKPVLKGGTSSAGKFRSWLEDEVDLMRDLLQQGSTIAEVALTLRRPVNEVEKKLQTLGLLESERMRNASGMMKARFA